MIKKIENLLKELFSSLGYNPDYAKVSVSNRPELCDFQVNGVFAIAKESGSNPKEIGESLVSKINNLDNFSDYFKTVEFAMPGFINITVSDKLISSCLNETVEKGIINKINEDITVVIDYGGPNIAKPLHVGHLRPAIIGQSIYNILKAKGYKVIGDVHLGDIGLQMGQVIYGLKERNLKPEDITIDILQEIYPKMSALCKEDESVADICRKITKDLQDGNEEYNAYFKVMYDVSLEDIKRLYKYLNVDFDYWYGEKDSYKYMDDLMSFLNNTGVVEEDDGAKIIRVAKDTDNKEMPPLLLQGKSGAYLYATSDIATIYQRMKDFKPNYILYVVDDRQSLHFEQVFRACEKSGLTPNVILEHNKFGTINGTDGKPFKTRSGEALKLDDLIKETKEIFISKKPENKDMDQKDIDIIVNAIIKFADLQNNREKNYIFDIDKFSDVSGKTGPYILYTAVRLRKLIGDNNYSLSDTIYNEDERNLRMKLLDASNAVDKAAFDRMPHYIAEYLYDLCNLANTFYQNNNISNEENIDKKQSFIALLNEVYKIIEKLLKLLIIEIPSKM